MPVAAVALAASSFAAGVTAIATATTLASTVMAGAMIVGGALSVIGTVTGNQKLAKIGGIISLAGGLGTLANNAMNSASAAAGGAASSAVTGGDALASGAADVAGGIDGAISPGADALRDAGQSLASDAAGMGAESGLIGANASEAANASMQIPGEAATQAAQGAEQLQPFARESLMPNDANAFATKMNPAQEAFATQDANVLSLDTGMPSALNQGGLMSANTGSGGFFDKFGNWVKANPELAKMGGQMISGFAGNAVSSPVDKARIAALEQQTSDAQRRARWARGLA